MQDRITYVEQLTDQANSDTKDMTAEAEKPRQFCEVTDDETIFQDHLNQKHKKWTPSMQL